MQKERHVCALLKKKYGTPHFSCGKPLDVLIRTILSQNTSDANSDLAFNSLKKRFATWDSLLQTKATYIEKTIRRAGLSHIKAKRIKQVLSEIKRRVGRVDISFLQDMQTHDAFLWLTSLPGVGPKTAAVVLMFCFEKPIMPVDTHVYRVSMRLGLLPQAVTREKAQLILNEKIPNKCKYSLHINMIKLGREICKPKKPLCNICILNSICDSAFKI